MIDEKELIALLKEKLKVSVKSKGDCIEVRLLWNYSEWDYERLICSDSTYIDKLGYIKDSYGS